jgi:hypothetical protein
MEYDFTLKLKLSEAEGDLDDLVARLRACDCDDALVGLGTPGRIALNFTRDAVSAERAIVSAFADVRQAIPAARLIEV